VSCGERWRVADEVYDYVMVQYCVQNKFEAWLSAEKKAQGLPE
jgi:hypothetical protein